ncbi:hypothetical protein ACQP2X_11695 [Actinoplanes sp. CA-131856]
MERERVGPFLAYLVERLPDHPAIVFSSLGEVLLRTPPAVGLLIDGCPDAGSRLQRYRHSHLGELELYHHVLVDPDERQILLFFTAVPGSASDEKLRHPL